MRLFLLLALVSFNAFALPWSELENYDTYTVQQEFELKQKERSGSMLVFPKGQKLRLFEKTGALGMALFKTVWIGCPGNDMETEMEIIKVKSNSTEVGVVAMPRCELWFYIEGKDYWSESLVK